MSARAGATCGLSVDVGSDARSMVDGVTHAKLDAARAVSCSSRNGVTGVTEDAAGAVSNPDVDGGGDGVTGATVAVGGTAEAAGAAVLGGSRRTRQG